MSFKFGTCTVPDGEKGDWKLSTFVLTRDDVLMANLRAARDGNPELICDPGEYKKLTCRGRGVIMSNTPMEVRTAWQVFNKATGCVLINGLGMGMVLEGVLSKPDVTFVRVIELEQDVVDLVAPHYLKDPRVEVVCADAYTYKPGKDEQFDYVWHDIWDDINPDNLPHMAKLTRKFARKAKEQGVWSREMVRRNKRRASSYGW
jgi:hypothetical protein